MAAVTRSLRPLMSGACSLRWPGVIVPSVFSSADSEPLLPSAATRTASRSASSWAASTAGRISASSVRMSVMSIILGSCSAAPEQGLGLERVDEGPSRALRRDPFILDAHPPARLRIRVIDEHELGAMHKALALLHHHPAVLAEEGVHER